MKILVVGSGAREHAIISAFHRSYHTPQLFCYGASVNPGIKPLTQAYHQGEMSDIQTIVMLAKEWQVNFAFIGPEAPLAEGLADLLWENAIPTIGPKKALAQIETSKRFARELMTKYAIPGAPCYQAFYGIEGVADFLAELGDHFVIKADGLMGGKGVKVSGDHLQSHEQAMSYCQDLFLKQCNVVIEEKLIGQEFSLMCFTDGTHIMPMPVVQDHKRAYENDKGPNTGGMGSYSDANHSLPFLSAEDVAVALQINHDIIKALGKEIGEPYIGILYGGFMATQKGVQVIEFNARLGDPEALNVLSILESDLVDICLKMMTGKLHEQTVSFSAQATVCKYVVPEGYPDASVQGGIMNMEAVTDKKNLYLGSVELSSDKIIMMGSRTAAYVGVASTIAAAEVISEEAVNLIEGPLFHRKDIGKQPLIQSRIDQMKRLRCS